MKKTTLIRIFIRSFFIHTTLNYRRMQNLGFALSVIPLIREWRLQKTDSEKMMIRHLQMFNTNPYFSAAVIGSIVRLEEAQAGKGDAADVEIVKKSLMASYAAIGDIFFWGALRPLASIVTVILAFVGSVFAPVVFLLVYTPVHIWIRFKGFLEGYRQGKKGFEFVRALDLPRVAVRLRWGALILLAGSVIWLVNDGYGPYRDLSGIMIRLTVLLLILLCLSLIKKGISQLYIIYGSVLIFFIISWTGFF